MPRGGAAVGIDLGGTNIKAAAFSPDGSLMGRWTRPMPHTLSSGVPACAYSVVEILSEVDADVSRIGLAAPGLVSPDERSIAAIGGKIDGVENFDWTNFLGRRDLFPVLNDAHAALMGEAWCGAAANCRNAILLTLGTGVGGAILIDGKLYKGALGRAGHFGHVSLGDDEDRSIYGMPGALELAIGNATVARRCGGRFSSTRQLLDAHRQGDAIASRFWLLSIGALARAIASFINILDPEVVIIGGGIANAGADLFVPLATELDKIEWRPQSRKVPVVPAQLGEWAGAYGAARNAGHRPETLFFTDTIQDDNTAGDAL